MPDPKLLVPENVSAIVACRHSSDISFRFDRQRNVSLFMTITVSSDPPRVVDGVAIPLVVSLMEDRQLCVPASSLKSALSRVLLLALINDESVGAIL